MMLRDQERELSLLFEQGRTLSCSNRRELPKITPFCLRLKCLHRYKIETLILWGGRIAFDFNFSLFKEKHSETRNYVVFGTEDEFYSQEDIQRYRKELSDFKSEWISYNGGHTIDTKTLKLFGN